MGSGYETDVVTRLETNLDDCPAEILGAAMERLLAAGALDVWFTPIQMKKHRPGTMLSVLCDEGSCTTMIDILLAETTAFGVRQERVTRIKLQRRFEQVTTPFGDVTVKLGLKEGKVVQIAPEFASCSSVAAASGQALAAIYHAAREAWTRHAQE